MNINFRSPSPVQANKQAKNMSFKKIWTLINFNSPISVEQIKDEMPPDTLMYWTSPNVRLNPNNDRFCALQGTWGLIHTNSGPEEDKLVYKLNNKYNNDEVFFHQYH